MTVYNKKGKPYTLEGVYCHHCMESSSSEEEGDTPISSITQKPKKEEVEEPIVESSSTTTATMDSLNEDFLNKPLLEESTVSSQNDILTDKDSVRISTGTILKSLLWLNRKLAFCEWKKLVSPILLLFIMVVVVWIISLISPTITKCPDGSYERYKGYCIDNNNPPSWDYRLDYPYFAGNDLFV